MAAIKTAGVKPLRMTHIDAVAEVNKCVIEVTVQKLAP